MGAGATFEEEPSYIVAMFFVIFLILSELCEHGLHTLKHYLQHHKRKGLLEALHKMKDEVMLLGFLSFILICVEDELLSICMPEPDHAWAVCGGGTPLFGMDAPEHWATEPSCADRRHLLGGDEAAACEDMCARHRHLLGDKAEVICDAAEVPEVINPARRHLMAGGESACKAGYYPMIGQAALHQTHIFIFVMAAMHIGFATATMMIAIKCVRHWHAQERHYVTSKIQMGAEEAGAPKSALQRSLTVEKKTVHTLCVEIHDKGTAAEKLQPFYVAWRFRKAFSPVTTHKLISCQRYFVRNRNVTSKTFNFPNYVLDCMEEDFVSVVGVSTAMWLIAITYTLIQGPWAEAAILILTLATFVAVVSMSRKLRKILNAVQTAEAKDEWLGDDCFWLKKPKVMLVVIRMTMFMNSFQLAVNLFFWWQFPPSEGMTCFYHMMPDAVTVVIMIMCVGSFLETAYVLMPMYSLCVNLGESYNPSIFSQSSKALILNAFKKKAIKFDTPADAAKVIQRRYRMKMQSRLDGEIQNKIQAIVNDTHEASNQPTAADYRAQAREAAANKQAVDDAKDAEKRAAKRAATSAGDVELSIK